ncbi:MAG: hypothetical protein K2M95_06580 [Clostridiales bacterium]|nr:hypothetical protein [Clostridiales bacterium]
MNVENENEALAIMEYVKTADLKGNVEIGKDEFLWDLGGIFLRFAIELRETTVFYSRRKSQLFGIGHFHLEHADVINTIQEINREDRIVRITVDPLGSSFCIVNKTDKKKKSWLIVRHYYSSI